MAVKRGLVTAGLLAGGAVVGGIAVIATTEIDRLTTTDAFCTSCHSMATLAAEPQYKQSAHQSNAAGVRVGCVQCHTAPGTWVAETYSHGTSAVRDTIAEYTHNFADPAVWDKRRSELASQVRDEMRHNDSANCRKCHVAAAIRPASGAGRAAHALAQQGRATCIDCHANRDHAAAPNH